MSLCIALLMAAVPLDVRAQGNVNEPEKPSKYVELIEEKPKLTFFQGFTLGVDVLGPVQYALGSSGQAEAQLRLNLMNTYFPVAELGYAKCDKTDENTNISYKTNAPYLRLGIDFNLLKDKWQDNRLYLGLRYGISAYQFDIAGPKVVDPVWGGSEPFDYRNIDMTSHWAELVFGVQVKVFHSFHMGWSIRYKREISSSESKYAKPYFIPGYGTRVNSTTWGGTYSLIFDLNWGKKKTLRQELLEKLTQ